MPHSIGPEKHLRRYWRCILAYAPVALTRLIQSSGFDAESRAGVRNARIRIVSVIDCVEHSEANKPFARRGHSTKLQNYKLGTELSTYDFQCQFSRGRHEYNSIYGQITHRWRLN